MPIPIEALAQMLSGQRPQSMEDMMNSISPFEQRTGGLLVDQRVPSTFARPPLHLREQGAASGEMYNADTPFPFLPVGDVMDFPKKNFHRPVGPTPNSADYMVGRKVDPNIPPVSSDRQFWEDWIQRQLNRKRIEDMGGLRG